MYLHLFTINKVFKQNQWNSEIEQLDNNNNIFTETPSEEVKSPCIYSFNVHARSSASTRSSASASASSSFYYNFYDPKEEEENNAEEPQESDDDVDELKENIIEGEQQSDVENVEVQEHCNQQNGEDKELIIDEPSVDKQSVEKPLKTEDETQVEEVEQ